MTQAVIGQFEDATDVELDVDTLVGSHLCIQANSGAGKSGAIRKLLETTHGSLQHIVLDVEDEFYTLREKYDYLIAGGDNGDCAANVNNAGALANTILKAGFSAIVQLNSLMQDEREEFIGTFLQTLTSAPKTLWRPLLLVLDEAQFYAPQIGNAASSSAVINFMMLGRKRGFTGILATPRAADLDKRATAPVNNWLVGRCGQPADRRAAAAAVGFSERSPEALELRSLPARTFWAFGPAMSLEPRKIKVGQTNTTIVKAGQATLPTPPAPAAMRKILEGLNAAAADEPPPADVADIWEAYCKEVPEARDRSPQGALAFGYSNAPSNETQKSDEVDPMLIQEAEQRGYDRGREDGDTMLREAVPIWFRRGVEAAFQGIEGLNTHDFVIEHLQQWGNLSAFDGLKSSDGGRTGADRTDQVIRSEPAAGREIDPSHGTQQKAGVAPGPSDAKLNGAAPGLLLALARGATSWDHAAVLAGIVPGNGYFYKGRKALVEGGYVIDGGAGIGLSAFGMRSVEPGQPPRLREIVALWTAKLRSPGDRIIQHLAKTPMQWISTDDLAAALDMKAGNGYWYKGAKSARVANLIDQDRGSFRLSEYLRSASR